MKTMSKKTNGAPTARSPKSVPAPPAASTEYQVILVPLDFSAPSERALAHAARLARDGSGKLILLHVVEPIVPSNLAVASLVMEDDKVAAACRAHLDEIVRRHKLGAGLVEKVLVRFGRAYHEICDAATTLRADLIVISTHGYTGLKHVLLGSTAERVVRHAPCPVLVIRHKAPAGRRKAS